jgi:hypothetical protein
MRRIGDRHGGLWHIFLADSHSFDCRQLTIGWRGNECLG